MDKKKVTKLLVGNAAFAAGLVFAFSPGFLGLRPTDANIIRAALSLTLGVMLPVGMVRYNYKLLGQKQERKLFLEGSQMSIDEIRSEMRHYLNTRLFGQVAQSSMNQLDKCQELEKNVEEILNRKFDKGSLTYQKFSAISQTVKNTILSNMVGMMNRMRIIDDEEYTKLLNYKNDDIPDDIQIQRLELYKKNIAAVKEQRNQNEGLLYKMDELLLELTASEIVDASKCKAYAEIDTLIKQIQYYSEH